jgi:hypothetical protein
MIDHMIENSYKILVTSQLWLMDFCTIQGLVLPLQINKNQLFAALKKSSLYLCWENLLLFILYFCLKNWMKTYIVTSLFLRLSVWYRFIIFLTAHAYTCMLYNDGLKLFSSIVSKVGWVLLTAHKYSLKICILYK